MQSESFLGCVPWEGVKGGDGGGAERSGVKEEVERRTMYKEKRGQR